MSELPWVRFFPSDWLAGTRGLSAAETGVYVTLVMMMYERGGPLNDGAPRLARLCGSQVNHFKAALGALIENGKLYRTEEGGLFNQRVRQELESRHDFASLQSARRKSGWDKKANKNNNSQIPEANRSDTENIPYQKPQPEKEEGSLREPRAREPDAILVEFEGTFWPAYPNKVGKPKALTSFRTERKSASLDEIMAGLARYVASKPADRQWLNPTTFLNQRRFNDQPAAVAATGPPRQRGPTFLEISQAAKAYLRDAEPDDRQPPYLRLAQ